MPANDAALQAALKHAADASGGRVSFAARTSSELGQVLGLSLARTPRATYEFDCALEGQAPFKVIAYTLAVDGTSRVATRAEALGKALTVDGGALFEYAPFLLIFDYVEERLMAVSAARLFGAFAEKAADLPYTSSASFSLTPSFAKRTVSMYATLEEPQVWSSSVSPDALTPDRLVDLLTHMRDETAALAEKREQTVAAIQTRLAAQPETGGSSGAIAELVPTVPLAEAVETEQEIRIPPRVWRMILNAIRSARAVMLVGPPGTGKTALMNKAIQAVGQTEPLWATPDESWTARELVGGDTVVDGQIVFRPGWVLRAIREDRWLIMDEANRADMDRIFGGLLTWLSGGSVTLGVESSASDARTVELGWTSGPSRYVEDSAPTDASGAPGAIRYLAGDNWRLLGTFNALDAQRVFRFGAALGRRFVRVPIPAPEPEMFEIILKDRGLSLPFDAVAAITDLYAIHFARDSTRLGPALFLAMAHYVEVALRTAEQEPLDTPDSDWRDFLAEAYLVHIGSWVGNLEPRDLELLQADISGRAVLGEPDWLWILQSAKSLV
ncbi:ATPase family protein [Brevundimonas diminuta 470-4]|nr:ATPase family protein [Brevundimonas diminuta 470-4]